MWVEKGIAWHVDMSSAVYTLIDNGKLANQIARLVTIMVKLLILVVKMQWVQYLKVKCNEIEPSFILS